MPDTPPADTPPEVPPTQIPPPVANDVQKLIDAIVGSQRVSGNADEAYKVFAGQLLAKDKRITDLESKVGQLPADVQAELDAYRVLGKPEAVKTSLEAGTAATQKAGELEQEKALGEAAQVLKLQGNALFKSLLKDVTLKIEGEGEARKVLVSSADGKEIGFEEYTKTRPELMDALPALQANEQGGGTKWVGGGVAGGTSAVNKYDAIRHEMKAKTEQQKPEARDLTRAGIH